MTSNLLAEMQRDGYCGKKRANTRGGEWQGPCILPRCGGQGKDRLRVQPSHGTYGFFECRVCNSKGSLVDYLMIMRGYTKQQALAAVEWKPKDGSEFIIPKSVLTGRKQTTHEAPCTAWQTSGKAFAQYCMDILWSEQGQSALEYLRGRGLKDETIKKARLGYNPAEMVRPGVKWGHGGKIVLKQGIVIPWFVGEDLWRVTIRDEKATEGENRYRQVAGSSNGLYLGYLLGYDRPVVLVEGELDALSIAQEAGHHVSPVATGSTTGSHTARWMATLATKDLVLIAFDAEAKGDKAAQWWLDRLENAHRLRPWWSDANQMLQDGVDLLNDWILPRIETILHGDSSPLEPALTDGLLQCYSCQRLFPDFEGWDPELIPPDDVMNYDSTDGQLYCKECRPDLFAETPIAEQEQCSQGESYVQALADALPGGCMITYQPRGYTIQQRAAELEAEARQARREQEARIRALQYNRIFKHSPILEEAM